MKIFKILICVAFVLVVSACHGKKETIYDYPDDDPTTAEKGNAGDPCQKNDDCKEGLLCIDKVCSEPGKDDDSVNDSDENPVDDKDDTDTTPTDDADSDTNDPDITPTDDDADTGSNDEDEPEDSDTKPDEDKDIPEYIPECGNGLRDPGEECDNGASNSDQPGSYSTCRTNCLKARCGDGIKDEGEICDDGNNSDGDYCSKNCNSITGSCGDGKLQVNEICDSALDPCCTDDCSEIVEGCGCGDGIVQRNEVCDNAEPGEGGGEGIGPYYCNLNCTEIIGSCGDTRHQDNEACDDGNNNGRYGYCNSTCSGRTYCGDGIVQHGNEECDWADPEEDSYCSSDCQEIGSCGDGLIQNSNECSAKYADLGFSSVAECETKLAGINEACDNSKNGQGTGAYCSADCRTSYGACGDGIIQRGNCGIEENCTEIAGSTLNEECDNGESNGNLYCPYGLATSCKVCDKSCKKQNGYPMYCGDGRVSSADGEACDKNNLDDPKREYCADNCRYYIGECGDGIIQEGIEFCDPNKADDPRSPYCSSDCKTVTGGCGDGILNRTNCDGYGANCQVTTGANEECDDGTNNSQTVVDCPYFTDKTECTFCNISCELEQGKVRYCGDGLTQTGYEECDDGNSKNGKYGFCNSDCSGYMPKCGDGIIDRENCNGFGENCRVTSGANEACDNGTNNGKTACEYGEENCKVCTTDCTETDGTITAYCGDGIIQREDCDGFNICDENITVNCCIVTEGINESCDDGQDNGTPGHCRAGCYSGSEYCGDGDKTGDEICDDGTNNGQYGYCASDCMSEGRRCGDGIIETAYGEECDDGENNGHYSPNSQGYCSSECKLQGGLGYCGDGIIQRENCDGFDICDENITVNCCIVTPGANEACDAGENNSQTACEYGDKSCTVCTSSCLKQNGTTSYCGDTIIDSLHGEDCDEGSANADYNAICDTNCKENPPRCGDGVIDDEFDEICDQGDGYDGFNGRYSSSSDPYCSSDCKSFGSGGWCGDGLPNGHETCDSAAMNGHYGGFCNNNCTGFTHKCGDSYIDTEHGEFCDDHANNGNYGYCDSECQFILKCGDGIWQKTNCGGEAGCTEVPGADEQCDYGETLNGSTTKCAYGLENCSLCDSECNKFEGETSYCGDSITDETNDEFCDSGKANNGSYNFCRTDCKGWMPRCGDGFIDRENCDGLGENCRVTPGANEKCDDGEENGNYDKCNTLCSGIIKCGDGDITDGETCDDGPFNGHYNHCDETCRKEKTGTCGDGILQKEIGYCGGEAGCVELIGADEQCDAGYSNNGLFTDCDYGIDYCEFCDSNCKILIGNTSYCGDGTVDSEHGEKCDDGIADGSFGHCDKECQIMVNYRCGDGKIQKGNLEECGDRPICSDSLTENCCEVVEFAQGDLAEICDDGALNGTPQHCNSTCTGWTYYCGDGIIQRRNCEGYGDNCFADATLTEDEECDDAGSNGYYGSCKEDCSGKREEKCGDGILHTYDCMDYNSCNDTPCNLHSSPSLCHQVNNDPPLYCDDKPNCETVPGAYEECDEGEDNGKYYGHCDENCSGTTSKGYCGDYKVQMASDENCAAWLAEDPSNRTICSESNTTNCCEVVAFAPGEETKAEICDEAENNDYHGHCNETCNGISACGDGHVGKDEFCEQNYPISMMMKSCTTIPRFQSGFIGDCDDKCMPDITGCVIADSYSSPFFKTGQTLCYNNNSVETCTGNTGSDFYGQEPEPNFSYTAHNFELRSEDTVVEETVSGLFWQRDTLGNYGYGKEDDFHYYCNAHSSCTFDEAEAYCSNLRLGGYNNWRLPTITEFSTIMNYYGNENRIDSIFTNTREEYWTQEGKIFSSVNGTLANPENNSTHQIKCVRSGNGCSTLQCMPKEKQKNYDFADIFITSDQNTEFVFWYFDNPAAQKKNWKEALEYCKNRDVNGLNKMRLPTVNELISLIGSRRIITDKAWTSTTLKGDATKAYAVDFSNTLVTTDSKNTVNYVICVE